MPWIEADDLDDINADTVRKWCQTDPEGHLYINVIDKSKLTVERLNKVLSAVKQYHSNLESPAVNPEELTCRLNTISPRRSATPSDAPGTPLTAGGDMSDGELNEQSRRGFYRDLKEAKDMGCRFMHELPANFGHETLSERDTDMVSRACTSWVIAGSGLRREQERWLQFRWHQFQMRQNPTRFNKYQQDVMQYQQEHDIPGQLKLVLRHQTKLDEWMEYYIYEHRKRRKLERGLERAASDLERAGQSTPYSKLNELRWTRSGPHSSKTKLSEEAYTSTVRRMKTKRLDIQIGEQPVQGILARKYEHARTTLQKLDDLLEWASKQCTQISSEYTSSASYGQYNLHILQGWSAYFTFMHRRLRNIQEGERDSAADWELWEAEHGRRDRTILAVEEARDDRAFPQHRSKPLQSLLAWADQQFPELVPFREELSQQDFAHQTNVSISPKRTRLQSFRKKTGPSFQADPVERRSPLDQVQQSKVSKRRGSHRTNLPRGVSIGPAYTLSKVLDDHCRTTEQVFRPVLRRSERIAQRAHDMGIAIADSVETSKALQSKSSGARRLRRSGRRSACRAPEKSKRNESGY